MELTTANKKTILSILQEDGVNGIVKKKDLTQEQITTFEGFAGGELDCLFDFTKTITDEDGEETIESDVMHCKKFVETKEVFMTDRDALYNYAPNEDDTEEEATERAEKLAELEAKETVTLD